MIKLNNLSLNFAGNIIFANVSLQIRKNDRIGLIGNNGSGKTSLLNLLSEKQTPTSGNIVKNNEIKVAHLPQELYFKSNVTLKEFVIGNTNKLKAINKKIDQISKMLNAEQTEQKQFKLIETLEELNFKKDGLNLLNLEIDAEKIMKGLGFIDSEFIKNINSFSGGWKMRAELSRLLVLNPDVLLLDEPTNHLDLPAIMWLEKFLNKTKCTIILVSHDTKFLDKNINRIFDVSQKTITDFKGTYSQYVLHREKNIERQIREKKNQDKYIKQSMFLINKFRYKKNKAAFAQTLIKRLNAIDKIEVDTLDISTINFQFPEPLRCGKVIFQSENLKKTFDNNVLFDNLNLEIYRGDRIAFVGKNGCGKTTLTKIINGELNFEGNIKTGEKVVINYFAQNQNELLDPKITIIDHIKNIPSKKTESQLRSLLGAFLFTGDTVYKKIGFLSGGEKARLCLCTLLLSPSNVIILDEPTNHLDVFSKDILKQALIQYKGTLILVSHDRNFLLGLTDRVIEFGVKKIREYPGNIDSYLDQNDVNPELKKPINKLKKINNYAQKKIIDKTLRFLNKEVENIECEITNIELEIKEFTKLINQRNLSSTNNQINYDNYNKLHDLLNAKLKAWEHNQNKINKIKQENNILT